MKSYEIAGLFLMGLRDSISLKWVQRILFFSKPGSNQIHPSSVKMLQILKNSLIQVLVFMIGLPYLFLWVGLSPVYYGLNALFLVLTYGYFYFLT